MAEFDNEELRRIFQNLGDRLANTKGDENTVEKLAAVEKAINKLDKTLNSANKKSKAEQKKDRDDLIKDLVKELNNMPVLNELKETIEDQGINNSGPGQNKIADEFGNVKGFSSAVGQSILAFGKFSSTLANAAAGIVTNFGNLNGSMSGFAKALGLSEKSAAAGMIAMVDQNVDAFRMLIESAEGTIGSIMDLREAMSKSSLGAEEFARAIAEGTQGTRLMGAQPWAQLYASIKQQTKDMAYYGYTTQGLVKAQNEYLEMASNRGDLIQQKLSDEMLAKGLDNLLKVNNDVATILGQTRDEALAKAAEQSRDSEVIAYMSGMNDDQARAANTMLQMLNAVDKSLGDMGKDFLIYDGNLQMDTAKTASVLPPEMVEYLRDIMMRLGRGEINQEQVTDEFRRITELYRDNITPEQLKAIAQISRTGQEQFTDATRINMGFNKTNIEDPDNKDLGTNIKDALTQGLLGLEQQIKNISAGVQDLITQFIFEPLTEFGDYVKSGFDSLDGFIQKMRETVSWLGSFDSAVKLVVGVLAGGALLNGVAGIVTSVVSSVFTKQIFKFAGMIAGPIAELTKGVFGLARSLGSSLIKALTSSITTAIAGSGLLGKVGGLAARAAPVAAAGAAGYAVGKVGGNAAADYLLNNHPEAAAWISENIFGNKVDAEAVKKARELVDKGESVTDFANQTPVEEETKVEEPKAEETPIVNKVEEPKVEEPPVVNKDVEPISDTMLPEIDSVYVDALDRNSSFLDRLRVALENSTLLNGADQRRPEVIPEDMLQRISQEMTKVQENNQLPAEFLEKIDSIRNSLSETMSDISAMNDPQTLAQSFKEQINLSDAIRIPEISQLDSSRMTSGFDSAETTQAAVMNNFIIQAQAVLERIYQTLKQTYEYSRENDQVVRDRLAELNKLQEDLIRVSKR